VLHSAENWLAAARARTVTTATRTVYGHQAFPAQTIILTESWATGLLRT